MRVLLVDDEESLSCTLQANLELDGFEVDVAASGSAALALLEQKTYDLMLSDIRMPGMNGVDLFRAVRRKHPELPVVLMTAFALEGLVKQAINEGVFTVFPKPFDITHLETVLKRALRRPIVLIVDDERGDAETTAQALAGSGLRTRAVCDAAAAVEVVKSDAVDVCVVDLLLSRDGGAELLQKMRAAEPGIMFIAVSGHDVPALMLQVMSLGTVACMRKPLRVEDLVQTIAQARRLPAPGAGGARAPR
jgi:DNA-binding NtrC family response regulator